MDFIVEKTGTNFIFFQNQKPIWKVELLRAFWGYKIAIIDLEKMSIVAIVKKQLRLILNARTKITFNDRTLNDRLIVPITFFSSQINFNYNNIYYEFIEHSGLNYSIFKDGAQIGMYKKQRLKLNSKGCLILSVNNNVDMILIISILTITDLSFREEEGISINAGNLIVSKIPFNKNWKPS